MESNTFISVPRNTEYTSHLVSNVAFWERQCDLLSQASQEHGRTIDRFLLQTAEQIRQMGSKEDLMEVEKMFAKEFQVLQGSMRQRKNGYVREADEYSRLGKQLEKFEQIPDHDDIPAALQEARTRLDRLADLLAKRKQEYESCLKDLKAAMIQQTEPGSRENSEDIKRQQDTLREKAGTQLDKYRKFLEKWKIQKEKVKQLSAVFEDSYLPIEAAKAAAVMEALQKTSSLPNNKRFLKTQTSFDQIDTAKIIHVKMVEKVPLEENRFEDLSSPDQYVSKARAGVGADPHGGTRSPSSQSEKSGEHTINEEHREAYERLRKMKSLYVVTKAFQCQHDLDLPLKVGDYVRQLLPAGADGIAYGALVNKNTGRKRKKNGYYPASHLTKLSKEDLFEDFTKTSSKKKSAPRKKKKQIETPEAFVKAPSDTEIKSKSDDASVGQARDIKNSTESSVSKCFGCFGKLSVVERLRRRLKQRKSSEGAAPKPLAGDDDDSEVTYTPVHVIPGKSYATSDSEEEIIKNPVQVKKEKRVVKNRQTGSSCGSDHSLVASRAAFKTSRDDEEVQTMTSARNTKVNENETVLQSDYDDNDDIIYGWGSKSAEASARSVNEIRDGGDDGITYGRQSASISPKCFNETNQSERGYRDDNDDDDDDIIYSGQNNTKCNNNNKIGDSNNNNNNSSVKLNTKAKQSSGKKNTIGRLVNRFRKIFGFS